MSTPVPTIENILERQFDEELELWAQLPLSVERHEAEDGESTYRATWPGIALARQGPALKSLGYFLNLAAPNFADEDDISGDLILQISSSGIFPPDLKSRHAASFGRAWERHEAYARRAYNALRYLHHPFGSYVEVDGVKCEIVEAEIHTLEEEISNLGTQIHIFPEDDLQVLFEEYGEKCGDEEIDDFLLALDGGTLKLKGPSKAVVASKAVSRLVERYPEAAKRVVEMNGWVIFDGGDKYDGPLVAYDTGFSREELEDLFRNSKGIRTVETDVYSFDYLLLEEKHEIAPVTPSLKIDDPRPHLQPVLMWKVGAKGRREIIYDSEVTTHNAQEGNKHYWVTEDPVLGVIIPFIFSPEFRADQTLWPKRDSLPADKTAERRGELKRPEVPTNRITAATVVLQAIRKRHDITKYFPFEKLEHVAS